MLAEPILLWMRHNPQLMIAIMVILLMAFCWAMEKWG